MVPKTKIYSHSGARSSLQKLFAEQVDQIIWANKLSPSTLNIAPSETIGEILIFTVILKGQQLDNRVLRAVDVSIPQRIVFEVEDSHRNLQYYKACFKKVSNSPGRLTTCTDYLSCEADLSGKGPLSEQTEKKLPISANMAELYEHLLERLMPIKRRKDESIEKAIERMAEIKNTRRHIETLSNKILKEKQFNKKIELNSRLNRLKAQLSQLQNS